MQDGWRRRRRGTSEAGVASRYSRRCRQRERASRTTRRCSFPALRKQVDVELIGDRRRPTALVPAHRIYHLGNNPHHAWIYEEAMRTPGVVVLHDLVLHHLIVEMTLARGDVEGYVAALEANHGEAGAAWARGRAAGLHSEMGNFLLPASIDVANRSRAVIVHNRYAAERLRSFGVTAPIHVVPHPFEPQPSARGRRDEMRAQHGFAPTTASSASSAFSPRPSAPRSCWRRSRSARARSETAAAHRRRARAECRRRGASRRRHHLHRLRRRTKSSPRTLPRVDRLVNLRYPSAGETSGTLIRAFEAGKPVAVSDYAQFAEFPDDCVVKIPFGDREVDALADFFVRDLADPSAAQAQWLRENASMELTVRGYLAALYRRVARVASRRSRARFRCSRKLEAALHDDAIVLRNTGDFTLRTRSYGEPGYRLMMLTFDGDTVIDDRWVELPRDLRPGDAAIRSAAATCAERCGCITPSKGFRWSRRSRSRSCILGPRASRPPAADGGQDARVPRKVRACRALTTRRSTRLRAILAARPAIEIDAPKLKRAAVLIPLVPTR